MTEQDPFKSSDKNQGNPLPEPSDGGSLISKIFLVLFFIFLGILGIGVLGAVAIFVMCSGGLNF